MIDADEQLGEPPEKWIASYGLSDIKFVECRDENGNVVKRKVIDQDRIDALEVTESVTLVRFDEGLRFVAPGLRRYGGTFMSIVQRFQEERAVIEEEMARIAVKNLTAIVSRKLGARRILNFKIAVAEKEARDGKIEDPPSVENEKSKDMPPSDDDPLNLLNE